VSQSTDGEIAVRPFRRPDRDQVTRLANAHISAVVPGMTISVNALMSQLEREPGEFLVDPWVTERVALVAEQRGRVVAAALLLRYGTSDVVGPSYRGAGEIRWLLCWPDAAFWPDAHSAGTRLVQACVRQLAAWGVRHRYASGSLPAPGVYGIPEQWPHVRELLETAGFVYGERTEVVLLADVADLPRQGAASTSHLTVRRTLGVNGTRLSAHLDGDQVGYIEVDTELDSGGSPGRLSGWADIGNLEIACADFSGHADFSEHELAGWLLARAASWLALAGATRVLDYCDATDEAHLELMRGYGFVELTRTVPTLELPG
jgi:GNAT superfamily N-acetyltransferase